MERGLSEQVVNDFGSIKDPANRRHLYRWIENHAWQGKLVAGGLYRDELHKLLNEEQRTRLEALLNEPAASK